MFSSKKVIILRDYEKIPKILSCKVENTAKIFRIFQVF